jgi:NTP pyrophosphatase (non-canonical NTP hydrolase)
MTVSEFQKYCTDIVDRIDGKFNIKRDAQLALSQLIEEIGELAKEVNRKKLRNKDPELEDLESEFADVFLQLAKLADMHGVDFEEAVDKKAEKLRKRGYLE